MKRIISLMTVIAIALFAPPVYTRADNEADGAQEWGVVLEYDSEKSSELKKVINAKYNSAYFTDGISSYTVTFDLEYPDNVILINAETCFDNGTLEKWEGGFRINDYAPGDQKPANDVIIEFIIGLSSPLTEDINLSLKNVEIKSKNKSYSTEKGKQDDSSITVPSKPTPSPTASPTPSPTAKPTPSPTASPTPSPTASPTPSPTASPTPTPLPTATPVPLPTVDPSKAVSGVTGGITWTYSNETISFSGDAQIPAYTENTAPWAEFAQSIRTINVEDGVTAIGAYAFSGLYNIEYLNIADSVRVIGPYAFAGCSSLAAISFPAEITEIGEGAFKDCASISAVFIPMRVKTIGKGAFEGCKKLSGITLPFVGPQTGSVNSKEVFSYIFNGAVPSSLNAVIITADTIIPEGAFEGCSSVVAVSLNPEITKIGARAFSGCSSLMSINIPEGVSEIGSYTFMNCASLKELDIPENVRAIGESAFDGCVSLMKINVPEEVKYIANHTFRNCKSLKTVKIPKGVITIGEGVLEGCFGLIDISVPFVGASANPDPTAVTKQGIFAYLFGQEDNGEVPPSVTTVEITSEEKTTYIPREAFKGCAHIEDIVVYGGRSVLDNAFANCRNLKNLRLPKSLGTIGNTILEGCRNLETLQIPFIGRDRSDSGTETSVLGGFFGYDDLNDALIRQYYDGEHYHNYNVPFTLTTVTVLNHTDIPAGAFSECDFLKKIFIASGASMGEKAFYRCSALEEVTLPKDLLDIGEQAFAECSSLRSINLPPKVRTIGDNAFYNDKALENILIPDSVIAIADTVFNGTNLFAAGEPMMELMEGGGRLTITCSKDSAAYKFAQKHNIQTNVVEPEKLNIVEVGASISRLSTGDYIIDVSDTNNLEGVVYAAVYDDENKLITVKAEKASVSLQGGSAYRFSLSEKEGREMSYAKIFIWGSAKEDKPKDAVMTVYASLNYSDNSDAPAADGKPQSRQTEMRPLLTAVKTIVKDFQ